MTYCDRDNRHVNIHIDLAAVRHNLNRARSAALTKKVFSVVKSDAYGHGCEQVVSALTQTDGFAVSNVAEGFAVRQIDAFKPVLVLQGYQSTSQLRNCIQRELWPVIHHREQLKMLAGENTTGLQCWIKVDTGMGRLGIEPEELTAVSQALADRSVKIVGILTHMASADRPSDMSIDRQLKVFRSLKFPQPTEQSVANSAALLSRPDSHYDWVRPGIMLYGANPFEPNTQVPQIAPARQLSTASDADFGLQPAMRVSAPVIAIRDFKRGDRIGYGGTYECTGPTRVAIVGAGYGDGYPRNVPAGTCVMLGNKRCPIIGRISMDSMSVDVSGLSVPPPIDYPVTLWGHAKLRVDEIASRVGTIPYELLCSIRGKRSWLDPSPLANVRSISDDP